MVYFKEKYNFLRFQGVSNIFQDGGSSFFQGEGGGRVKILISMETYRTCDFPFLVRTPYPPSGSAHDPDMKT